MPSRSDLPSDDERTLQPSDDDILQEEEDRERLLATPTSAVKKFLKRDADPNAPRSLTKREVRRQRRREKRSKRRKKGEDEGLMFEMDSRKRLDSGDDDDSISVSSTEVFIEKPQPRWVSRLGYGNLT